MLQRCPFVGLKPGFIENLPPFQDRSVQRIIVVPAYLWLCKIVSHRCLFLRDCRILSFIGTRQPQSKTAMRAGLAQKVKRDLNRGCRARVLLNPGHRARQSLSTTARHSLVSNPALNDAATTGGMLLSATTLIFVLNFLTSRDFIDRVSSEFISTCHAAGAYKSSRLSHHVGKELPLANS